MQTSEGTLFSASRILTTDAVGPDAGSPDHAAIRGGHGERRGHHPQDRGDGGRQLAWTSPRTSGGSWRPIACSRVPSTVSPAASTPPSTASSPRSWSALATVDEVRGLLAYARANRRHLTFRTAGTSLSGQAVSDDILVELAPLWRESRILDQGRRVWTQPGVVGGYINLRLAALGYRLGPDPASIDAAMMGGIVANNSSGMCCGVVAEQLPHAGVGGDRARRRRPSWTPPAPARTRAWRRTGPELHSALLALRDEVRADDALAAPHPQPVRAQEHHRLQPQRLARPRRAGGDPRPPHGRLAGHARLPGRDDAAHGARSPGPRHRAAVLPRPARRPEPRSRPWSPRGPRRWRSWTRRRCGRRPATGRTRSRSRTAPPRCWWSSARRTRRPWRRRWRARRPRWGRCGCSPPPASRGTARSASSTGSCARGCSRRWAGCGPPGRRWSSRTSCFR